MRLSRRLVTCVLLCATASTIGVRFLARDSFASPESGYRWEYEIRTSSGTNLASVFQGPQLSTLSAQAFAALKARRVETPCDAKTKGFLSSLWSRAIAWVSPTVVYAQDCSGACEGHYLGWFPSWTCGSMECPGYDYNGGGPYDSGAEPHSYGCDAGGSCCYKYYCFNPYP